MVFEQCDHMESLYLSADGSSVWQLCHSHMLFMFKFYGNIFIYAAEKSNKCYQDEGENDQSKSGQLCAGNQAAAAQK